MSETVQYQIKDPQGGVYGPATLAAIGQWIREGRISSAMLLAPEGTQDWRPITSFPELASALGTLPASPAAQPYPGTAPTYPATPTAPMSYGGPTTNGMAIAALVCSLVPICMPLGGILGIIFALVAKSQIRQANGAQTGQGLATAGLIIGVIHVVGGICLIVAYVAMVANNPNMFR